MRSGSKSHTTTIDPIVKSGIEDRAISLGSHSISIRKPSAIASHARYLTESATMQSAVTNGKSVKTLINPKDPIAIRISLLWHDVYVPERSQIHREMHVRSLRCTRRFRFHLADNPDGTATKLWSGHDVSRL